MHEALHAFWVLLKRDMTLAYRHRGELANPLLFFVIVVSLFPLGVGPDSKTLQVIGPGIIWVAALLAAMLSLDSLFRSDYDDGALEQLSLSPYPLSLMVLAKVFAHWLVTGLPLILIAPILGVVMFLPAESTWTLIFTLALGTPVLSLVGSIGVALTVGLQRGGVLLSLLVLPLYIPVLIFAANAVNNAAIGMDVSGQLFFLGALLVLALTLTPLATASALRISLN
ncbi:heme exporter protein CcmB [Candidatus Venteria ishoeyi]|uniref:Heme exporter protein B n=1 Tax=Candidatus Venteria ishoeyi TaxID=1899563 RepID=A0A1H6F7N8_9GAMM|nr:heme exporter protein CcmB [Candidatus Venteria ishoeyi]MDM8545820.1 heme exporter protein CcmB [Candidatus Venteria ishoeyi]SEH04975.1 Heme exporter protein B [Candidatus Venteria ishoeyi]